MELPSLVLQSVAMAAVVAAGCQSHAEQTHCQTWPQYVVTGSAGANAGGRRRLLWPSHVLPPPLSRPATWASQDPSQRGRCPGQA
eukprot:8234757-Lingulodinium_polyedra.AAC.1